MWKFIWVICLSMTLSACYFKSKTDLHTGMQEYKPTQFYKTGKHVFKLKGGSSYIALNVFDSMLAVREVTLTSTTKPTARYYYKIYHDGAMAVGDYIVYKTSGSGSSKLYNYYAFTFLGEDGFRLIKALESDDDVSSRSQLVSKINARKKASPTANTYNRVSGSEAKKVLDHIESFNKKTTTNKPSSSGSSVKIPSGIDAFDVGDAVFLVDEPNTGAVKIIRLDRSKKLIKIRRPDNTVAWLTADKVSINKLQPPRYVVCLHNTTNDLIDLSYRWGDTETWSKTSVKAKYKRWFSNAKDIKLYVKYDKDLSAKSESQTYYLMRKKSTVGADNIDCDQGMHYDFKTKGSELQLIKAS